MQEKYIKIGSTDIHYKEYGAGNSQTLLILHGWGGSSDSWSQFSEILEQNKYKIIIPDLPGFGKTEISRVFDLNDYAVLIENFALELSLGNIVLWGHSNGGAISIKIANRGKLNIERLVLNNSAGIRNDNKRSFKRKILNNLSKLYKKVFLPLNSKGVPEGGGILKKIRNLFYRAIGSQDYLHAENNKFLKQTYLNMISSDLKGEIPKISQNTLLIWGEKDTYTPVSDGYFMRENIKNSKMVVLPDEKHGIHLQNPNLLIHTFLNNI